MGFFEDRAKQLGVTTNSNDAFFEQRAKHFQQVDEYQTYGNQMKSAFQANPESFSTATPKPTKESAWKSVTNNPIVKAAGSGLSWIQKPFEAASTVIADDIGLIKNKLGRKTRIGSDGKEFTSTPSQSRNAFQDVKDIFSKTDANVSSDAWKGAFPNLNKLPGTDVNITDALDFAAQSLPIGEAMPLKIAKALKLGEEAKTVLRPTPDYSNVRLTKSVSTPDRLAEPKVQPVNSIPDQQTNSAEDIATTETRVKQKATSSLDESAQFVKEKLKNNPKADTTDARVIIGASHIANGSTTFEDFSRKMIGDFGEFDDITKPDLKELFNQSKLLYKDTETQASGVAHLPGVNSGIDPLKGDKVDIMSLENALENSPAWKDKNRLLLNRETTERNFEGVMGKDAPIMNKTYIEPIQKSAADRQRFIEQERSDIKDLGIKYGSDEDALVQKYGEGKMSEAELKKESPDNWQKIKTAAETMRSKYDKYLDEANVVLKRNGYPEIPKRKDYFPHYEEIDSWMNKLGFGFEDNTLPADLNGLTANLKPGKNFFTHALQRKFDKTTLGALAGHDRYIEGISKIIHQTDNIKRLRGLDKTLRETHEGTTHLSDFLGNLTDYTNILAGKKTEMDRSLEAGIGRNLYSAVDWLKRRVGANMIGGSVSSALTNTIPVTQLVAETNKTSVLKGLNSAIKNISGNDSISQESDFLTRRFASDKLAMGTIDKAQKYAGSLFKFIDHFTSNMVIRSKYYENINKKGMPHAEAIKDADKYATRMMGDRSEGSMPTLFHSRTFGLITQFQLEVNNQLSHLFKDMPKSMSKGKYASAIAQVFIYDYLYNQVYEKVTGNRPAFDPIGVLTHAVQDFTNPRISKGKAKGNLVKNVANNLPFASVITGGRIPLEAAMPNVFGSGGLIKGSANVGEELLKPAKYLALPFGGSQINKTVTGLMAVNKGGEKGKNADGEFLKYPIANSLKNKIKAALFGKNALPETGKYYDDNIPALTVKETAKLDALPEKDQESAYKNIIKQKAVDSIKSKVNKIKSDSEINVEQKSKRIGDLVKQYNKILAE